MPSVWHCKSGHRPAILGLKLQMQLWAYQCMTKSLFPLNWGSVESLNTNMLCRYMRIEKSKYSKNFYGKYWVYNRFSKNICWVKLGKKLKEKNGKVWGSCLKYQVKQSLSGIIDWRSVLIWRWAEASLQSFWMSFQSADNSNMSSVMESNAFLPMKYLFI